MIDTASNLLVKAIPGVPGVEGVEYVPGLKKVYTSDSGDDISLSLEKLLVGGGVCAGAKTAGGRDG